MGFHVQHVGVRCTCNIAGGRAGVPGKQTEYRQHWKRVGRATK